MLLLILETRQPLDEVVFFDTGMEFQAIYDIRDKVKPILEKNGVIYTELVPPRPFLYDMLECPHTRRKDGITTYGYGWCGGACRWGTGIKKRVINRHTAGAHVYVGIAADEPLRLANLDSDKSSPIANAGMTEADCLQYCYQRGYFWEESGIKLYDILDRVSCWCCRNKNLKELRNIYWSLPEYWERFRFLQDNISIPLRRDGASVFDLEDRFLLEKEWINSGKQINTRAFYDALKEMKS